MVVVPVTKRIQKEQQVTMERKDFRDAGLGVPHAI